MFDRKLLSLSVFAINLRYGDPSPDGRDGKQYIGVIRSRLIRVVQLKYIEIGLLSMGINVVKSDAKNEQTHQRCHRDETYPDASRGRVKKDDRTGEE